MYQLRNKTSGVRTVFQFSFSSPPFSSAAPCVFADAAALGEPSRRLWSDDLVNTAPGPFSLINAFAELMGLGEVGSEGGGGGAKGAEGSGNC